MILVTTGTNGSAFDRLLGAIDGLEVKEGIVVQHGPSKIRPTGARCVAYVPFDELVELVTAARLVVTHGGVGSILVSLIHGTKPIVVPRRPEFGEAVDEHQVTLAHRLDREGLVTALDNPHELAGIIDRQPKSGKRGSVVAPQLVGELKEYLHSAVRSRSK